MGWCIGEPERSSRAGAKDLSSRNRGEVYPASGLVKTRQRVNPAKEE
ncbi:hypothetical protein FOPG_18876, partial [Fusarium oxysporum f. sp. conglutinans race 2 54008]